MPANTATVKDGSHGNCTMTKQWCEKPSCIYYSVYVLDIFFQLNLG